MRYIKFVACFALCVASLPATNCFCSKIESAPNDPLLLNRNGKYLNEYVKLIEHQRLNSTHNRQKRSLWNSVIKQITAVVETFHMKPILAEGINDASHFGKKFKHKLHDNPKFLNVMLRKATEVENTNVEEDKWYDALTSKQWVEEEADLEKLRKEVTTTTEVAEENRVFKLYDPTMRMKTQRDVDEENRAKYVKEAANNLINLHRNATEIEEGLFDHLIDEVRKYLESNDEYWEFYDEDIFEKNKIKYTDLMQLYSNGAAHIDSEKTMNQLIRVFPSLRYRVLDDLKLITSIREKIKTDEKLYNKDIASKLPNDKLIIANYKLKDLRAKNKQWFEYKYSPKFFIIPEDVVKPRPKRKYVKKVKKRKKNMYGEYEDYEVGSNETYEDDDDGQNEEDEEEEEHQTDNKVHFQ